VDRIKKLLQSQTAKDALISFVGLGITAVIGLVYTVVLARVLGPEKFGVFSAITALIAIIYSLGDLGIASTLINLIPKLHENRQVLINTSFWFEIVIGVIILIIFGVFSIFNKDIIPGSLSGQLLLAGIIAFNYLLINFAQGIFTAERKFVSYSLSQIIDAGIKITLILILLYSSKLSITTAFFANVISTIIALLITFSRELVKIKWQFDKPIITKIFHFAKWIAISKVFSVFVSRIDVIFLNLLSSSYQAGIFAAANRITLFFALLVSSLGSVITPRFSGFNSKDKIISYIKKLTLLIGVISFLMILSALLANPIIKFVFGDKYLSAVPIFQALTIAMIPFMFTLETASALVYSFNRPDYMAKLTAIQVTAMVILEIFLIPRIGAFAPAIALGITNLFVLFVTSAKLHRLLKSNEGINAVQ
jgi:O-antigen/teichoic acid export membrane protein